VFGRFNKVRPKRSLQLGRVLLHRSGAARAGDLVQRRAAVVHGKGKSFVTQRNTCRRPSCPLWTWLRRRPRPVRASVNITAPLLSQTTKRWLRPGTARATQAISFLGDSVVDRSESVGDPLLSIFNVDLLIAFLG
jgi:hypothetical protein